MNKNTKETLQAWLYVLGSVLCFGMLFLSLLSTCHGR